MLISCNYFISNDSTLFSYYLEQNYYVLIQSSLRNARKNDRKTLNGPLHLHPSISQHSQ